MNKYMMDDDRDILYAGAGWNVYMNEINTTYLQVPSNKLTKVHLSDHRP
jgi:hypothetical protein